jgi:hypothetical protein
MTKHERRVPLSDYARGENAIPWTFWLLGAALVVYVALCTPYRENVTSADAWEHHRAIKALTENLWQPGNPTYATDETSIR